MIDPMISVRAFVAGLPGVAAVFGKRVYVGKNLPSGYLPTQGPAVLMSIRGGGQHYSSQVWRASVQMRIYAADGAAAATAAMALYSALNDQQARLIAYSRMEDGTLPQPLTEPESDWNYVLMYWLFHVRMA